MFISETRIVDIKTCLVNDVMCFQHMFKTLIIFVIQCTLLSLVLLNLEGGDQPVEFDLIVMRFICVLFLHIQLSPEIE